MDLFNASIYRMHWVRETGYGVRDTWSYLSLRSSVLIFSGLGAVHRHFLLALKTSDQILVPSGRFIQTANLYKAGGQ